MTRGLFPDMDFWILDEAGNVVHTNDVMVWGRFFDNFENRNILQDVIEVAPQESITVSSVFIGIDHGWGSGPPLLFETMIFGGEHDGWEHRYATLQEAMVGHSKAKALACAGLVHENKWRNEIRRIFEVATK